MHNPTTLNRQGPDHGSQYRSGVFWHDEAQHAAAEKKVNELNTSGAWNDPVVTEITQAGTFWPAEEYHQRYLEKNSQAACSLGHAGGGR